MNPVTWEGIYKGHYAQILSIILKKNKMRKHIFLFLMVITTGVKCQNMDIPVDKNSLLASDYRLFQSTPGWNLAKAVMNDDVSQIISEIKKNPALIDYTDIRFGQPILKFAIMNRNYESAKVLLKLKNYGKLQ